MSGETMRLAARLLRVEALGVRQRHSHNGIGCIWPGADGTKNKMRHDLLLQTAGELERDAKGLTVPRAA